jgi:hypothetical protein
LYSQCLTQIIYQTGGSKGFAAAPANHTRVPDHESRAPARRSATMEMECGNEGSSLDYPQQVTIAHLQKGLICSKREKTPVLQKRMSSSSVPVPFAQGRGS